jgi:hypothetical protein
MRMPRMVIAAIVVVAAAGGAASTSASTKPTLIVNPPHVMQGKLVAFTGSHWGKHRKVTLFLGKPGVSSMNKIADRKTNSKGHFRYVLPVKPNAPAGQYLIIACRKSCQIKVSKPLEIVAR